MHTDANLSVTWDAIARAEKAGAKAIRRTKRRHERELSYLHFYVGYLWLNEDLHSILHNLEKNLNSRRCTNDEKGLRLLSMFVGNRPRNPSQRPRDLRQSRSPSQQWHSVLGDVLKRLALGVKTVGLGRPFMYANCYGLESVTNAIQILKTEIA
ncbi:uncharacterized protein BDR25DRAFT_354422 [Lindgomyces ingoldianus]|uniref:Uncharacterized protein n=1 Tax=Lindgomyces ingoldianus TaxID=673940 RepID=A0ACB6QX60_9PLEO|nr:uncharacterized protein BDR25DRAFT_354422 [Lindgomyces ingoldianus]KAF2471158.1 hypothetical protein BDR25DRAFT_354422 [Lindgomyces ingoldianus]